MLTRLIITVTIAYITFAISQRPNNIKNDHLISNRPLIMESFLISLWVGIWSFIVLLGIG